MITSFQLLLLLLATISCFGGEKRLECEQDVCTDDTKQVGCLPFIRSKVSGQLHTDTDTGIMMTLSLSLSLRRSSPPVAPVNHIIINTLRSMEI